VNNVLELRDIGKAYRRYASEWHRVFSWFGARIRPAKERWVLRDISFSVAAGEAVGIIGQNGAGKSTLLKIITGTLRPSCGAMTAHGRIAAILELGMGFNPEFTGRQNAFHALGAMGFAQAAILALLPDVEAFADIGDYFDQPMRTYSTGMQVRVAFAVVTAHRPDVLIIDEALSVGDSYFQHKSFGRIQRFKAEGTTVLFVTHGLEGLKEFCDRVILLDQGRILKEGSADEVCDLYNALLARKENELLSVEQRRTRDGWLVTRSGTGEARIVSLTLADAGSGNAVIVASVGQQLVLTATVAVETDLPQLVLGFMLRDKCGNCLWGSNTWHTRQIQRNLKAGSRLVFQLMFTCALGPGSYSFSPALVSTDTHLDNNFEWTDNLLVFDVVNVDKPHFIGSLYLDGNFNIQTHGGE